MADAETTKNDKVGVSNEIGGAFGDSRFSDLVVKCQHRIWNVHRIIVCRRCKFLESACAGNFMEATGQAITFDDDPPDAVQALLQFLYSGNYDGHGLLFHTVHVHIIANKYGLDKLAEIAASVFQRDLLAFERVEIEEETPEFIKAIRALYCDGTNRQAALRSFMVTWVMKYHDALLPPSENNMFRDCIDKIPAFAIDLVAETLKSGKPSTGSGLIWTGRATPEHCVCPDSSQKFPYWSGGARLCVSCDKRLTFN